MQTSNIKKIQTFIVQKSEMPSVQLQTKYPFSNHGIVHFLMACRASICANVHFLNAYLKSMYAIVKNAKACRASIYAITKFQNGISDFNVCHPAIS